MATLNSKFSTQNSSFRASGWQARRVSNPQPSVLETDALPIELLAFKLRIQLSGFRLQQDQRPKALKKVTESRIPNPESYSSTYATTPAPTVLPPSRIAKRSPSSIAMGWISATVIETLSPGITISVPFASSMEPVTSVVRK